MDLQSFITHLHNNFDNLDKTLITEATNFQDLEDFSSLTILEIIAIAKTKFGKAINGKDILACQTIGELYNMIINK